MSRIIPTKFRMLPSASCSNPSLLSCSSVYLPPNMLLSAHLCHPQVSKTLLTFKKNSFYIYSFILCLQRCGVHAAQCAYVEVGGQLARVGSVLPPCGS